MVALMWVRELSGGQLRDDVVLDWDPPARTGNPNYTFLEGVSGNLERPSGTVKEIEVWCRPWRTTVTVTVTVGGVSKSLAGSFTPGVSVPWRTAVFSESEIAGMGVVSFVKDTPLGTVTVSGFAFSASPETALFARTSKYIFAVGVGV